MASIPLVEDPWSETEASPEHQEISEAEQHSTGLFFVSRVRSSSEVPPYTGAGCIADSRHLKPHIHNSVLKVKHYSDSDMHHQFVISLHSRNWTLTENQKFYILRQQQSLQ